MKHSIEDLAERADDHGDGYFYVLRHGEADAPPAGRWEAGMREKGSSYNHTSGHGDTPDAAVQDMLNQQEPAR